MCTRAVCVDRTGGGQVGTDSLKSGNEKLCPSVSTV